MTITDAMTWARSADAGDYLLRYEDTGLTHGEDPGSRCGFDDRELAEIGTVLRGRGLQLQADDQGLIAEVR